jgi:RHS repeat-associated protein
MNKKLPGIFNVARRDLSATAAAASVAQWRAGQGSKGTPAQNSLWLPCYDGNGNVTEIVAAGAGTVGGQWEYSAFGETVTLDGAAAAAMPFRFSTKCTDGETGLVYYGYRYYAPEVGRWLGRDPIGERGGVNLFGMVGNDAVGRWDVLGLAKMEVTNSLYERSGDLNMPGRGKPEAGWWDPNFSNYPLAHYKAVIEGECNSEGKLTKASWDFKAWAASGAWNIQIDVSQDEGIEGENIYTGWAKASYHGSLLTAFQKGADLGSGLTGWLPVNYVISLGSGLLGGVGGAILGDHVEAKSYIKLSATCECDEETNQWKPKLKVVGRNDEVTRGDNYWR